MSLRTCVVALAVAVAIFITNRHAQAQQPSITGKWTGVTVSSLGDKADIVVEIEEQKDGTITGTFDGRVKIEKGERVTAELVQWETTDGGWRYCFRCAVKGEGKSLVLDITATKKEGGEIKGYTATSVLTKSK